MAGFLQAASSFLGALPNELLDHVLTYLATDPLYSEQLRQIPSHDITSTGVTDLKNFSCVSSRFRELSRTHLFTYTRFELRDQDRFLAFLKRHSLTRQVRSVVVSIRSIYHDSERQQWWTRLLDEVEPENVIIIAPPYVLAEMAECALKDIHIWAFNIPLQVIQLRQPPPSTLEFKKSKTEKTIFRARPWTEILFNEGSSLRAYSNYEYYLLCVPSFMDHWGSVDPLQHVPQFPYPLEAISRLTSFHYTAIFPFYNHTNLVLKVIRNMSNLRHVSFKLAPPLQSTILEEEQKKGALDPNDPWMELDTSYSLISHSVRYLGVQAKLQDFQTFDYQIDGLRDSLVNSLDSVLKGKWKHHGGGLWVKLPLEEQRPPGGFDDTI